MRILVIEDDESTANFLRDALSEESYAVDNAYSGEEGENLAENISYDLILLDIILPGKDGTEVCKSLRLRKINTPILVLSGKTSLDDKIKGLDSGADDYLIKPFLVKELYARVRALLRRRRETATPKIEAGNLVLDTVTRQVWKGQREVKLRPKEYAILEYLMCHPDTPINRAVIEQHVWNISLDCKSNFVDAQIKNLRAKLDNGNEDSYIETIRGVGFRLKVHSNSRQECNVSVIASFTQHSIVK